MNRYAALSAPHSSQSIGSESLSRRAWTVGAVAAGRARGVGDGDGGVDGEGVVDGARAAEAEARVGRRSIAGRATGAADGAGSELASDGS